MLTALNPFDAASVLQAFGPFVLAGIALLVFIESGCSSPSFRAIPCW